MTKLRPPVSIENTLFRVLGAIGIERAAEVTGREQSYLRSLSDPDNRYNLSMVDAIKLDLAHLTAGFAGAPLHETYTLLLEHDRAERFAEQRELALHACTLVREGAEAEEALILASLPGADDRVRATAAREIEGLVSAAKKALGALLGRKAPPTASGP